MRKNKVFARLESGRVVDSFDLAKETGFTVDHCRSMIHSFNRGEKSEKELLKTKSEASAAGRKATLFARTPLGILYVRDLYKITGGEVSKGALEGRVRKYNAGVYSFDQLTSRDRLPSGAGCKAGKGCVKEGFKVDVKGGRRSVNDLRKITKLDRIYGMGE